MPMNEDMAVFFNASEFGSDGVLDGVNVVGILDVASYFEPASLIAGARTTYLMATAAASAATTASTLVVGVITYRVRSIEPDGTGLTLLSLESQA